MDPERKDIWPASSCVWWCLRFDSGQIFALSPKRVPEVIYLVRATVFIRRRRVCQSEECGWCWPPTSNLIKKREIESLSIHIEYQNTVHVYFLNLFFPSRDYNLLEMIPWFMDVISTELVGLLFFFLFAYYFTLFWYHHLAVILLLFQPCCLICYFTTGRMSTKILFGVFGML